MKAEGLRLEPWLMNLFFVAEGVHFKLLGMK